MHAEVVETVSGTQLDFISGEWRTFRHTIRLITPNRLRKAIRGALKPKEAITLLDAGFGQCRWLTGEKKQSFPVICGKPSMRSYCRDHARIVYVIKEPKPKPD